MEQANVLISMLEGSEAPAQRLAAAALARSGEEVAHDDAYYKISYPGGDIASGKGQAADLIIRSFRKIGIDLQQEVHEDMKANFRAYPQLFDALGPDTNIDHRRVPNLQTFFKRRGISLKITEKKEDYLPGDLVTCTVAGKLPHIMIVSDKKEDGVPMIVHNIGGGTQEEARLFDFPITGHYRWFK